jgi:hypothetical protein
VTGPLETERQARQLPAVQAIYEAWHTDPGAGKMAPHTLAMLLPACEAGGSNWAPTTGASSNGWPGGSRRSARRSPG